MNILVISGHTNSQSLCHSLAQAYAAGAQASAHTVQVLHLGSLQFQPQLPNGFRDPLPLEPDLQDAQRLITWAQHIVWVYPIWWGLYPPVMKGFIDRVFLPGFAFKYRNNSPFWDRYLKGKSARLLVTMDAPGWYNRWISGRPGILALKRMTLEFSGINPVRYTVFDRVRFRTPAEIKDWLAKAEALGRNAK